MDKINRVGDTIVIIRYIKISKKGNPYQKIG